MTIQEIHKELSIAIEQFDSIIMEREEIPGISREKIEGRIEGMNYARVLLEWTEEFKPTKSQKIEA